MREFKHLGAYGIIIEKGNILLIKKFGGPYNGKLDLPGGTIEFGERPKDTLKRELLEEVGIAAVKIELQDVDAVLFDWNNNGEEFVVHHIGIFYNVLDYKNEIQSIVEVTEINDDSMGAEFYEIDKLRKKDLSNIAILELEKLGYNLKWLNVL